MYYCFCTPLFLLISTGLTVTNNFSACHFDFWVGQIFPARINQALTFRCSRHSAFSMVLSRPVLNSKSATQSFSLSVELSKSPFQLSLFLLFQMLSGTLSSSLSTGQWSILVIWQMFNIRVRHPGKAFADNTGGKGNLSDKINAAAPSCWKSDQNAWTISTMSEIYPMAVLCLFWARDSVCVAHRFWLPCHISKKSWTLGILCNFLSNVRCFISESFSVFIVSNAGLSIANMLVLGWANCLTTIFSRKGSPVDVDCLQQSTSWRRVK